MAVAKEAKVSDMEDDHLEEEDLLDIDSQYEALTIKIYICTVLKLKTTHAK